SHKVIMNMLGVSHIFIWRTKQVIKETGKPQEGLPGQGRKRPVRTPRLTKAVAGKIFRKLACSINKMAQEYDVSARTIGQS
ncbi:Hypothetical protein FKW44_015321, partial [Caligus rogercresseyi]